ncbi:MAG TPA: PH domain-containing protein [Thermomicrobiales bacterium]|nr:PH domain-containing protein [Thermomicrobiales bacterium]
MDEQAPAATGGAAASDAADGGAAPAVEPPVIRVGHHPLLLLRRGWPPGLLMLAAATATVVVATSVDLSGRPYYPLIVGVTALAFFGGGAWFGALYLAWGHAALYLTGERLVEIVGVPRVSEERRSLPLERVQSVAVDQRGPLARWCRCGDLVIDVAGGGPLRFALARDALGLRALIMDRLAARDNARAAGNRQRVRATVRRLMRADGPDRVLPPSGPPAPGGAPARRGRRPRWRFGRRFEGAVWRRHPWFLVKRAVGPAALVALAGALPSLLDRLPGRPLEAQASPAVLLLLLGAGGWLAWLWADWRNDHYVVTPDRLIEVEQLPLGLRQQVSEAALNKVQDIRYRLPTPLAFLLDYGDVAVHTAGATTPFIFRGIARPRALVATIDYHLTASRLAREARHYQELRAEFAQWLEAYRDVSQEGDETPGAGGAGG